MARLPIPGQDQNDWGNILNDFLRQSHDEDGALRGVIPVSNIMDFGARPDGLAGDNWKAIDEAIKAGHPDGPNPYRPVYIPHGTFDFDATIANNIMIPMYGPGILRFTGDSGVGVKIDPTGLVNQHGYPSAQATVLRVIRASKKWVQDDKNPENENSEAGIAMTDVFRMPATFFVQGFSIGLLMQGCEENTIHIQRLRDNRVAIRLDAADHFLTCNQNTFIGGKIDTDGGTNEEFDLHGIEFLVRESGPEAAEINGNVFINQDISSLNLHPDHYTSCFHGHPASTKDVTALENLVVGFRFEATDYVLSGKGIVDNEFRFTRGNPRVSTTPADHDLLKGSDAFQQLILAQNRFVGPSLGPPFKDESVRLASWRAGQLTQVSDDEVSAPARGAFWDSNGDGGFTKIAPSAQLTSGGVLQLTDNRYCIGLMFDLRHEQWQHLRRIDVKTHLAEDGGRMGAVLFDANRNQLTDGGTYCTLAYSPAWKHHLSSNLTIAKAEVSLVFAPEVAYAFVGMTIGDMELTNAFIKGVDYYVMGQADIFPVLDPALMDGIPMFDTTELVSSQPPLVSGIHYPGTFVRNTAPVELGLPGGKYIIAGWTMMEATGWVENRSFTGG